MLAQDSPYRPYWWAFGLEAAGVTARPSVGTYGKYEFAALPEIPRELTGDFSWLADQPVPEEWSIGTEPAAALPELEAACDTLGIALPAPFLAFLRSPELQSRIRSCTACFVDVGPVPVKAPGADGHLIRFLADQQGCVYWYLHVTGTDHAVVSSVDYYGGPRPEWVETGEVEFCSESVESFLYRFWLENEIWYAVDEDEPMPEGAEEYIRRYQAQAPA